MLKKYCAVIVMMMLLLSAACQSSGYPKNMPAHSKFVFIKEDNTTCGTLKVYVSGTPGDQWIKFLHGSSENPFVIFHGQKLEKKSVEEVWVDKNMDGRIDEHYGSADLFENQYSGGPCDIFKK